MKINKFIIPAIIAKNQQELDNRLERVINHVDLIQLDVMDNKFVPNNSLFFDFNLPEINCNFEAHLMVIEPEKWIEKNWNKVDLILVHLESCKNPHRIIQNVK